MGRPVTKQVKPIIEALKQGGRVFAVAVIPLLIDQLTRDSINWRALIITGVIAVLMAVDKGLHEEGKETGSENLTKGLTRF
jgi:hypothetical protein